MQPQEPEQYFFEPTPHVPNSILPVLIYRDVLPLSSSSSSYSPSTESTPTPQVAAPDTATSTPTPPGSYPSPPLSQPSSHPNHTTADTQDDSSAQPATEDYDTDPDFIATRTLLEKNQWIQGGVFKTYRAHHFHSVTHECYAVVRGESLYCLGVGPLDACACGRGEGAGDGREAGEEEDGKGKGGLGKEIMLRRGDVVILPAGVAHHSHTPAHLSHDYTYIGAYPLGSPPYDNNFCRASPTETKEKAETAARVGIPECDPVFGSGGPLRWIWGALCDDMDPRYF